MRVILIDNHVRISEEQDAHYLFLGASTTPQLVDLFEGIDYTISPFLTEIYDVATKAIRAQIEILELAQFSEASETLIRGAVTPLMHLFVERLARLLHVVGSTPSDQRYMIPWDRDFAPIDTIEKILQLTCEDAAFNQGVLGQLAPLCGAKAYKTSISYDATTRLKLVQVNKNFISVRAGEKWNHIVVQKLNALKRRFNECLSQLLAREMVFSPGTATQYYRQFGVIGAGYWLDPRFSSIKLEQIGLPIVDQAGRLALFDQAAQTIGRAVEGLMVRHKSASFLQTHLLPAYISEYLNKFFPIWHLEGAAKLLGVYRRILGKRAQNNFYLGNTGFSTTDSAVRSIAVENKAKIIGFQHGGFYGYTSDLITLLEGELRYCDHFLTWGWDRLDLELPIHMPKILPLPSPWLSQRSQEWQNAKKEMSTTGWPANTKFDLLFMPTHLYRFPPSPTGKLVSTICNLAQNRQVLQSLCEQAFASDLIIRVKFFNAFSYARFEDIAKHFSDLGILSLVNHANKGLVPDLVREAAFVIWDRAGTGFLECLAVGLPSMVVWKRSSKDIPRSALPYFSALEDAGVIFADAESLIASVKKHRSDPLAWLKDPDRSRAIRPLTQQFARSDPNWVDLWKRTIISLRHIN